MHHDPTYAEAFATAKQMGADWLEDVAVTRATQRDHPSDTLLIFLLKGAKPEKYGSARADREDKQSISDLLKAVLLEMATREHPRTVTPDAQWAPLAAPAGALPAPPAVG